MIIFEGQKDIFCDCSADSSKTNGKNSSGGSVHQLISVYLTPTPPCFRPSEIQVENFRVNLYLKREFSLLLIVTDDLGNSLLSNNFEAVCNANNPALTSSVRKRSSALCSPTSAWNSDAQYCIFNTKFWAKLGICEISDSKNFGFSATSTSTGKRVLDFFLQNPETLFNFLSNELLGVW